MDIWSWVSDKTSQLRNSGEFRLAEIIDELPEACCDSRYDEVAAYRSEGVALAKQLKEPWVELFIRHWFLQSEVLKRNNAKGMLPEAIDLLALSHSEEAKGCPQRICTVQDLANCYGTADGPGFANERLAVSEEGLSQIDYSWACYTCIAAEYLGAMLDAGDYENGLLKCKEFQLNLAKSRHYNEKEINQITNTEGHLLIKLGRYEEAYELLINKNISYTDGSGGKKTKICISLALAYLKRFDEIKEHMFDFDEVFKAPTYYNDWAEIQYLSVTGNHTKFDDDLALKLRLTSNKLIEHGSYRCAFNQLIILIDLSLENNFFFNAHFAIEQLPNVLLNLNQDLGANAEFEKRKARYESDYENYKSEIFSTLDDLTSHKHTSMDEYALSIQTHHQSNPEDIDTAILLAKVYAEFSQKEKGLELVENCYQNNDNNDTVYYQYGSYVLEEYGEEAFFQKFNSELDENDTSLKQQKLQWLYGRANYSLSPNKAIIHFNNFLALNPESQHSLYYLAWLYCQTNDYEASMKMWHQLLKLDDDTNNYWGQLLPATLIKDWKSVRTACEKIGIKLNSESGKVDENLGSCRIKFNGDLGSGEVFSAQRTGPVSARINGINDIDSPQKYGQEIVFLPSPLNTLDQKDDEGYPCDIEGYYNYLYDGYRLIDNTQPYLCYAVDGIHPEKEQLERLIQNLNEEGFVFELRSTDEYKIEYAIDNNNTGDALGLYAYILIPTQENKKQLHDILSTFSQNQKHPLIWPKLLEELNLVEELEAQNIIEKRYNL